LQVVYCPDGILCVCVCPCSGRLKKQVWKKKLHKNCPNCRPNRRHLAYILMSHMAIYIYIIYIYMIKVYWTKCLSGRVSEHNRYLFVEFGDCTSRDDRYHIITYNTILLWHFFLLYFTSGLETHVGILVKTECMIQIIPIIIGNNRRTCLSSIKPVCVSRTRSSLF